MDYLDHLEAEAIYILREVAGQFEKPALLFSGGKDSITLVHLAKKAFRPGKFPFPLVHIDTGHNFPETITFRDSLIEDIGEKLIVGYVQDSIDQGKVVEQKGKNASRNALQTVTLLDTIAKHGFDACI
ncbi:MAG TPA: sulfate adenylyltransferase small subunit, partial [Sphingobacterium sp.]|nr:sulfate adenylyltransferase small subunit [Sphingobacterium sp.]